MLIQISINVLRCSTECTAHYIEDILYIVLFNITTGTSLHYAVHVPLIVYFDVDYYVRVGGRVLTKVDSEKQYIFYYI